MDEADTADGVDDPDPASLINDVVCSWISFMFVVGKVDWISGRDLVLA